MAYEQLEETVWSEAARPMHDEPSPQRTLDYMGQLLISDIALYGNRPPSTVFNQIEAKLVKRSAVEENCTILRSNDPKELPWTNLAVERRALKRRVKDMKAHDLPAPHEEEPGVIQIALPSVEEQRQMVQAAKTSEPDNDEAFEILKRMAKSTDGMLLVVGLLEGTNFQIGQENVNRSFHPRELAFLRDAVERLERDRLIRSVNRTSDLDLYEITSLGYKQVERL